MGPTGVTRRATIRVHTCHSPILAGLDADRCALPVAVDPYALTTAGEVWSLRAGRDTYVLHQGLLHLRTRWDIPSNPAGSVTVLAEHRCGHPPPIELRQPATPPAQPPAKEMF
jgi:hypothetical protein